MNKRTDRYTHIQTDIHTDKNRYQDLVRRWGGAGLSQKAQLGFYLMTFHQTEVALRTSQFKQIKLWTVRLLYPWLGEFPPLCLLQIYGYVVNFQNNEGTNEPTYGYFHDSGQLYYGVVVVKGGNRNSNGQIIKSFSYKVKPREDFTTFKASVSKKSWTVK